MTVLMSRSALDNNMTVDDYVYVQYEDYCVLKVTKLFNLQSTFTSIIVIVIVIFIVQNS